MTERYCATGRVECPHLPECVWECKHDMAVKTRKVKPYPAIVTDDIDPMPDQWHTMGQFLIGAVFAAIVVFFSLVFITGIWIWSLLI